jgi:hypothetical protein
MPFEDATKPGFEMPTHEMRPDVVGLLPLLYELARRATHVLEIGCGNLNGSSQAFLQGLAEYRSHPLHDPRFVSVDLHDPAGFPLDGSWYAGYPALARCGFWDYVRGDSREPETVRQAQRSLGAKPDVVYIDTEHTYEQMAAELDLWMPLVGTPGTLWLFHDTWMSGEYNTMTDAIKERCPDTHAYADLRVDSNGLGALVPKGNPWWSDLLVGETELVSLPTAEGEPAP